MWVTGDVGSSPASSLRSEKTRLKVKRPPRGLPFPPRAPRAPAQGRRRGRVPGRCKPGGWGPAARSAPALRPPLTSAYLPRRRRRGQQRRQRSKQWGWARRRATALIPAAAPGWRRRGKAAQGHFVITLLVTGSGRQ
ncbi:uncharacterized protein LOC143272891 [Peromyscus maniculatus bairdii]|uniref:uncharacterized protein LOC143272891 n=1 Tax=Peromyscus maniculatus bairdii TaxID=230844 RepID=UPI003FD42369